MGHIPPMSFKVIATLAAYRIVGMSSTAETVHYNGSPATVTSMPFGVSADTVLDTVSALPVYGPGQIAKVYFNDTCGAGGFVTNDTSGRGIQFAPVSTVTASTVGSWCIGRLVGPAVSETGTIADVFIMPQWVQGANT